MAYEYPREGALNYFPVRYGDSKLLFRGPKADLGERYVAFLGGTETYGKYVETPYPDLVGEEVGCATLNLGCVNAGLDAYLNDETVMDLCAASDVTVLQITGAQNMSNRFYAVHPRRNDRFLRPRHCCKRSIARWILPISTLRAICSGHWRRFRSRNSRWCVRS